MSPSESSSSPVNRWLIAIAVMSSAIMEVLDTSVVNVSLPHIAGSMSASVDEATWVLTSYLIANAVILPISGWLANIIGRKRLLLIVVSGFTIVEPAVRPGPEFGRADFLPRAAREPPAEDCNRSHKPCCWRSSHPRSAAKPWPSGDWALWPPPFWGRRWVAGSPIPIPGAGCFISTFRSAFSACS